MRLLRDGSANATLKPINATQKNVNELETVSKRTILQMLGLSKMSWLRKRGNVSSRKDRPKRNACGRKRLKSA